MIKSFVISKEKINFAPVKIPHETLPLAFFEGRGTLVLNKWLKIIIGKYV